nr:hypothetical protein [Tanacetum cinerariifolium]
SKLSHGGLKFSFRRNLIGGVEQAQFERLKEMVEGVTLRGKSVVSKITPTLRFKSTRNETKHTSDNHNFVVAAFYNACKNGASDVVLDIHHGEKRFVGFTMDTKSLDADVNRKHIYGAQILGLILHGSVSPHINMVKVVSVVQKNLRLNKVK